jgi:hypothetical protein
LLAILLILKERARKEIKLRDFEVVEKMSLLELESIELSYLKKLYMIAPKVIWFLKKKLILI